MLIEESLGKIQLDYYEFHIGISDLNMHSLGTYFAVKKNCWSGLKRKAREENARKENPESNTFTKFKLVQSIFSIMLKDKLLGHNLGLQRIPYRH